MWIREITSWIIEEKDKMVGNWNNINILIRFVLTYRIYLFFLFPSTASLIYIYIFYFYNFLRFAHGFLFFSLSFSLSHSYNSAKQKMYYKYLIYSCFENRPGMFFRIISTYKFFYFFFILLPVSLHVFVIFVWWVHMS